MQSEELPEKKLTVPKIPVEKLKEFRNKPTVSLIVKNLLPALYSYLVVFLISQFLISGGQSERAVYFIVTINIFIVASQIFFMRNNSYSELKSTITSALTFVLTFAILDYLIVNLFLEKNNLELYRYWPNYFAYLILLVMPFIRSRWQSLTSSTLKSLLTKQA